MTNPALAQPEVRNLPRAARALELRAGTWNDAARTIEVTWSTGARVARYDWSSGQTVDEELDMSANAVRLGRLNAGAPVLNSHAAGRLETQIGVVVPGSARLERGVGIATLRLSERPELEGIVADIRAGIIRNVSIGYAVHRYQVEQGQGERALWRAVDWEPFEISFTPVPADPAAQSRASVPGHPCTFERNAHMPPEPTPSGALAPAAPPVRAVGGGVSDAEIRQRAVNASLSAEDVVELQQLNEATPMTREAIIAEIGRRWAGAQVGGAPQRNFGGGVPMMDGSGRIAVGRDEGNTLRAAISGYLDHRLTGRADLNGPERQFLGLSIGEVLRAHLVASGQREAAHWSRHELVSRSMHVSSDFPNLLTAAGNRYLVEVFRNAESPIKRAMRMRQVPDFRELSEIQLDGPGALTETPEGGEVKFGTFVESAQKARVKTFAQAFTISRQALINDDLSALSAAGNMMALAAANTEAREIANLLLQGSGDGPVLADTVRLFSTAAQRSNKAGAGSAITVDNLGVATAAMRQQRQHDGVTPMNARARFILVGAAREMAARQVVATSLVPNQTSSVNPFAGELEVLVDARMTGNSWRLFADPGQFPVLGLAYLEGRTAPEIESFDTVTTLGLTMRVVFDFVPYVIDWRGSYLNPGA